MHPVYSDKCFTMRTLHVWCKTILDGQKFVSDTEVQSVVLQWHRERPASFFASDIQKLLDRSDKRLSKFEYVEK